MRSKFTQEKEDKLLDAHADPVERAASLNCMHADGVVRHEELVVSFLDHASPHLRAAALRLLLRWGRFEYTSLAIRWLSEDPERTVRVTMTSALAWVAHYGGDFDAVARALVKAVETDPNQLVASEAYHSARVILVPEGWFDTRIDFETFDRKRDVDWDLLAPYRAQPVSSESNNRSN